MCKSIDIHEENISLLDFTESFNTISSAIIDELYDYKMLIEDKQTGLYTIPLNNKCVKKIIFHHVIKLTCERLLNTKTLYKKIIIIQPHVKSDNFLCKYCDCKELNLLIIKYFKEIHDKLPICVYFLDKWIDFDTFDDSFFWHTGEGKELMCMIQNNFNKFINKTFTFEKMKKIVKKYELTFLSKNYFDTLKIKQLMVK